jgi:hypothetical protein
MRAEYSTMLFVQGKSSLSVAYIVYSSLEVSKIVIALVSNLFLVSSKKRVSV